MTISRKNTTPNNKTVKNELKQLNKNPQNINKAKEKSFQLQSKGYPALSPNGAGRTTSPRPATPMTRMADEVSLDGDEDPGRLNLTPSSIPGTAPTTSAWQTKRTDDQSTERRGTSQAWGSQTATPSYIIPAQQERREELSPRRQTYDTQRTEDRLPFSLTPPSPIGSTFQNEKRTGPTYEIQRNKEDRTEGTRHRTERTGVGMQRNIFWDNVLHKTTSALSHMLIEYYNGSSGTDILKKYIPIAIDIVIEIMDYCKRAEANDKTYTDNSISGHSI